MPAVLRTDLPFPKRAGKVRDVYDLGGDALLIVATDRISAFDCVLPTGIPDKGKLLTQLSLFWFDRLRDAFESHLISADVADYPASLRPFAELLRGRSMLVKKARVVQVECVARGYLAGSGWAEYRASQAVCGVTLPPGLRQCDRLPTPIFTPATKEESGHDVNVSFDGAVDAVLAGERTGPAEPSRGHDANARARATALVAELRDRTLALYARAAAHAAGRGILIADTKFEFGRLPDGRLIVVDEVLTPDSSRFWPADRYAPGQDQPSYDKQFVRNWLDAQPWDKRPPAPALPADVVAGTRARYVEAYEKLTGTAWQD